MSYLVRNGNDRNNVYWKGSATGGDRVFLQNKSWHTLSNSDNVTCLQRTGNGRNDISYRNLTLIGDNDPYYHQDNFGLPVNQPGEVKIWFDHTNNNGLIYTLSYIRFKTGLALGANADNGVQEIDTRMWNSVYSLGLAYTWGGVYNNSTDVRNFLVNFANKIKSITITNSFGGYLVLRRSKTMSVNDCTLPETSRWFLSVPLYVANNNNGNPNRFTNKSQITGVYWRAN